MDFNIQLAKSFLESTEEFPVGLDQAWVWLGYSTKQKALSTLKSYFQEGVDYIFKMSDPNSQDEITNRLKRLLLDVLAIFTA